MSQHDMTWDRAAKSALEQTLEQTLAHITKSSCGRSFTCQRRAVDAAEAMRNVLEGDLDARR